MYACILDSLYYRICEKFWPAYLQNKLINNSLQIILIY
ncbi:MAG: hypothetical protein ACI849_001387 [Patiriisocius sp.]